MTEQSVNGANAVRSKKKNKKFKAIKGLITGKTRRQRRQERLKENDANPKPLVSDAGTRVEEEEQTVFGANFDNQSVASSVAASGENDVSNIDAINIVLLLMDPLTRRFELLQLEFDANIARVQDIFSQIPVSATEPSLKSQNYKSICDPCGIEMDSSKKLSDFVAKAAVVIAVPDFPDGSNGPESAAKMAKPILSNAKVAKMLQSSGLDLPIMFPKSVPESVPEDVPSNEVKPKEDLMENDAEPLKKEEDAKVEKVPTSFFSLGLFFFVLAHFLIRVEKNITSPLGPGDSLSPGQWKSKCGMVGLLPTSDCNPSSVEMGRDGIFKVFEGKDLVFSLRGATCSVADDKCTESLLVESDGTIKIGGKVGKVATKASVQLSPWPFTEGVEITNGKGKWY